jgi:hypothetical protein
VGDEKPVPLLEDVQGQREPGVEDAAEGEQRDDRAGHRHTLGLTRDAGSSESVGPGEHARRGATHRAYTFVP